MDEILAALIIAVVQGITEWIPISSKGHIVILEHLLNYHGGLIFEVALHFGTLMAVFVYFGKDIVEILRDVLGGQWKTENGRLGLYLIIATIPAAIVGFLLKNTFERDYANLLLAAFGFAITGLFLLIASFPVSIKNSKLEYKTALGIGVAQIFALFPGISRSGTTIGAGLLLGLKEQQAIKFSFLLSIPIILGANILVIGNQTLPPTLIFATLVSFIVGLITIHLLYKKVLTSRKNLRWFAFYALALAAGIGTWILVQ